MNKELIEKYNKLRLDFTKQKYIINKKNEKLEELRKDEKVIEILKLLKNEKIREYFKLLKECNSEENIKLNEMNELDFIDTIYDDICFEDKDTNGIYVCLGKGYPGYKTSAGKYVILSQIPEDIRIPVALYKNLEYSKDKYVMPIDECEEFERTHTVIEGEYDELSKTFIYDILCLGNDKAMKRLLKIK